MRNCSNPPWLPSPILSSSGAPSSPQIPLSLSYLLLVFDPLSLISFLPYLIHFWVVNYRSLLLTGTFFCGRTWNKIKHKICYFKVSFGVIKSIPMPVHPSPTTRMLPFIQMKLPAIKQHLVPASSSESLAARVPLSVSRIWSLWIPREETYNTRSCKQNVIKLSQPDSSEQSQELNLKDVLYLEQ